MIRFAKIDDIENIMKFINDNWKQHHILSTNREIFEHQHDLKNNDKISYVISLDEDNNIDAILGYISYSNEIQDIMLALWKSINKKDTGIGIKLLMYLNENINPRILASTGINDKVENIYKYLGYHTGIMKHWYRLSNKGAYNIAKVIQNNIPKDCTNKQFNLIKISNFIEFKELVDTSVYENKQAKPFKDIDYIKKRYFEHPIYKYYVYGIDSDSQDKFKTIIILRNEEINNSKAIRFVDCVGEHNQIQNITDALDYLMIQENAEYIDIYNSGLDDNIFNSSGWIEVGTNENIIPNYFSPFVQENVDIRYFTSDNEIILFKGDGDQDRPN